MTAMIKFDLPKNQSSIIKVMGVGGGGSNAVTHMYNQGIEGVDFVICNTDSQALDASAVPTKIQLGSKGLGAGSIPSVGKESALEKVDDLKELFEKNTQMVFITAGMGGGTGTGAAPVIAAAARELGILTVGIVTMPFSFEGRKRRMQAEEGMEELKKHVDTLLVIVNDKLRMLHGDLKLSEAFSKADDILTIAAKGIAEIITVTGYINVDFEDVKTVMKESGKAIMGSAEAEGENRAIKAVEEALSSPLLNDSNIKGASNILLYISSGEDEISMDEVIEITDYIEQEAGPSADVIWGNGTDSTLGAKISITLIATGFNCKTQEEIDANKIVHVLTEEVKKPEPDIEEPGEAPIENIELIRKKEETVTETPRESVVQEKEEKKETERTIVFDLTSGLQQKKDEPAPQIKEPTLKKEETVKENTVEAKQQSLIEENGENGLGDIEKKAQERIQKLKDLSIKLRSPKDLSDLENQPAYMRRNVKLADTPSSADSHVSKYHLSEDEDEDSTSIKKNNSFLHDKPD